MSGLATAPRGERGTIVYCPCCHRHMSHVTARNFAIAAGTEAETAKAEPRHGDTLPIGEILRMLETGRFIGSDQYDLAPICSSPDRRGRREIYSNGILALGVTWPQVHSRNALATALFRADRADEGVCQRCIEIEIPRMLPLHLSFDGDDPRLFTCRGGFSTPDTVNGEQSFIEWGAELRAQGHDTSDDPRFHGKWAEDEHRGVLLRRRRSK